MAMKLGKIIQFNTTYQSKLIQELKFSTLKICHAKFHENRILKNFLYQSSKSGYFNDESNNTLFLKSHKK